MADKLLQPGAHLAAAFGARGAPLDADEARRVLNCLLRLYELGTLEFFPATAATPPEQEAPGSLPDTTPQGVVGCGTRGGRQREEGCTLTNRQPSKYSPEVGR